MALVQADVIGLFPIVDARSKKDIEKGNRVVLDDEATNIDALVTARLIENVRPLPAPKAKD